MNHLEVGLPLVPLTLHHDKANQRSTMAATDSQSHAGFEPLPRVLLEAGRKFLAPNLGPILSFRMWNSLTCAHSLLLEKYSQSWQLRPIDTFYMFVKKSWNIDHIKELHICVSSCPWVRLLGHPTRTQTL